MRYVIDRIEEGKAVLETESSKTLVVPIELLGDVSEGDAVHISVEKAQKDKNIDTHSIFEKLRNKSKNND